MDPEQRLAELGLTLPGLGSRHGRFERAVEVGNLLFLSGHGPQADGQILYRGKVGQELEVEDGYQAARLTCLNCLAAAKEYLGTLARVRRVVKLVGFVNSTPEFTRQPDVMNGASDLLLDVFGDAGRHARSSVGVAALPGGIAVEIEMVLQVAD